MGYGDVAGTFRRLGLWGYVIVGIFLIVVAYFLLFHLEHLAAYSTAIFLVLFFIFHILLHSGHGMHGRGHGSHGRAEEQNIPSSDRHSHTPEEKLS